MKRAQWSTACLVREMPVAEAEPNEERISDEALLARFLETRDQEAFSKLVLRHQDSAYRVALARCGRRDLAEDAVQDAFMELARKKNTPPTATFKAWFFAVVSNLARHRMRTEFRSGRRAQSARCKEEAVSVQCDNASRMDSETQSALSDALDKLHEDLRMPLVLYFVEGMTQDEIGATVGLSQPLIARRISQGLEKLRARLSTLGIAVGAAALPEMLKQAEYLRAPAGLASTLSSEAFIKVALSGGRESMRLAAASMSWGKIVAAVAVLSMVGVAGMRLAQQNGGKTDGTKPESMPTAKAPVANPPPANRHWEWDLIHHSPPKGLFYGPQLIWDEGRGIHTTIRQMASMVLPPLHYRFPLRVTVIMRPDELGPLHTGLDLAEGNNLIPAKVYTLGAMQVRTFKQDFKVVTFFFDNYLIHVVEDEKVMVVLKYANAERFTRMILTVSNLTLKNIQVEELRREEIPAYVFPSITEAEKLKPTEEHINRHVLNVGNGGPPPQNLLDMLNAPFSEEPAP